MGVDPVSLALIGTTILTAGAGVAQSRKTAADSRHVEKQGEEQLAKVEADRMAREKTAQLTEEARLARQRQRALFATRQGFPGTVLTSKIGLPGGGQQYAQKTLLGA